MLPVPTLQRYIQVWVFIHGKDVQRQQPYSSYS
ncbi:unnamed protein product [Acanthoscelides obtectus]|uniref:Uncharacterized protein n=1 Tax=Acanthoscelides obtectus TaxID=200917 RepID=A0A9P0MLA1_ACAOB|nr:unnamed protein product [Acanthoscelides obtectus]CAK1641257.1 hypothetical protein AOBTE_LOCUS12278 [Acanthoscelides obtectus]